MGLEVGQVLEGKVSGITKFGAFISLSENKTGLVHISEIANTYVNDVREHLTEGQEVKVKVISIGDEGKVSLSIKKAVENQQAASAPRQNFQRQDGDRPRRQEFDRPRKQEYDRQRRPDFRPATPAAPETFEDRLSKFMQDSKSNMSGSKAYGERRTKRRGGGGGGQE